MKKIINAISFKFFWFFRVLLKKIGLKRKFYVNNLFILIDYDHRLPDFKKDHAKYDTFLPHLSKFLKKETIVIDIGANVGDTLLSICSVNSELKFICIEADFNFYSLLKKNTFLLKKQLNKLDVHLENKLVGYNLRNVSLEGNSSTKYAKFKKNSKNTLQSISLNKIFGKLKMDPKNISLIKIDVDGYDYNVLKSAFELINQYPLLYFEVQFENIKQFKGYKTIFNDLIQKYNYKFFFFDNFGNYITSAKDVSEINNLLNYLANQNFRKASRTIDYYDVLGCPRFTKLPIKNIINSYMKANKQ